MKEIHDFFILADMRASETKDQNQREDNLFGLLSSYKIFITYFRILVSSEENRISVQVTDNPKNWVNIDAKKYISYSQLRRLEIGIDSLSVKYVSPLHLLKIIGPLMGLKIPGDRVVIYNELLTKGFFIIETSLKYKNSVIQGIRKLINLPPQKKYEILEKCLMEHQE